MAKRKRNQQATAANSQVATSTPTPSKKPKLVNETPRNAGPKAKPASGKPTVVSPDTKRQSASTASNSANPEAVEAPGPARSAKSLKRERKRKRQRELKKNDPSAGQAEDQKPSTMPDQKTLPQGLPTASVKSGSQPTAVPTEKQSAKSKARQDDKHTNVDSSIKPSNEPPSQATSRLSVSEAAERRAEKKRRRLSEYRATEAALLSSQQRAAPLAKPSNEPQSQAVSRPSISEVSETRSKKKLRRQSAFRAKQAAAHKSEATPSAALLQQTSKTQLVPRLKKQWVEQDDVEQGAGTSANDAFANQEFASSILDPLAEALREPTARFLPAQKRTTSSSGNKSSGSVNELPRFLATVGVPSPGQKPTTVSTPPARPGINTIASFSLSSRRHPASVLAKQRPSSGLSGIRMDTGMIGSSPKPVSANKANSVPSYAGTGDVKAAFDRFNKFAHGGNSSGSDEDSDESDEESNAGADATTGPTATSSGLPGINNTVRTNDPTEDRASVSAESSESDSEASGDWPMEDMQPGETAVITSMSDRRIEVPNTHEDTLARPPNNAPRMLGEKDLPLFSSFNAKHNITSADTVLERSANFLGRELGGAPSGFGQTDDAEINIIDYVASQDADDLYQSIEDISREVFGSIRDLPDCKPLSNSLDVATERFVTDKISNHGLGRKSAELGSPLNKTTALGNIVRGSSPIVYIANEMDVGPSTIMEDGDDEQDEVHEEEQNTDDEYFSDASKDAKFKRHTSAPPRLIKLTTAPTPSEVERQNTSAVIESHEIEIDDEHDSHLFNSNGPIPAKEGKKRKLTGTTSKHFSPRKSLPRAASDRIRFFATYAEVSETSDTDNEVEQPSHPDCTCDLCEVTSDSPPPSTEPSSCSDELCVCGFCEANSDSNPPTKQPSSSDDPSEEPQHIRPEKTKGTGMTSTYFTPTSSSSKSTDTKRTRPLPKTSRPPKGTSICPVPSTESTYFGLIQEQLWKEPFWLIIAVTLLNKTTGRAAVPIFWNLRRLYPTPMALAQARKEDLVELIGTLGLQNQRSKRLIKIAGTWVVWPPVKNQCYRTLHYPAKGDGKEIKKQELLEEDTDIIDGALEIGHIPGCGPYAYDSWRIFCRDVQRGLAQGYNDRRKNFQPEWQRVLPRDKELRACLRWMWLREGWVWDPETGERRDADLDEILAGIHGEMEFADEHERHYAIEAAGVDGDEERASASKAAPSKKAAKPRSRRVSIARRELDVESGDEVAVSTERRSRRDSSGQRSR